MNKYFLNRFYLAVLIGIAIVGTLGIASSKASAQTLPQSGNLQLCVRHSGIVFAIGYGFKKADCRKNDKLVTVGQGSAGITGVVGPQGPVGDKGLTGDKGPIGDKGISGDIGQQGQSGAVGSTGPTGAKGLIGDKGPNGNPGTVGDKGPTGNIGPQGPVGEQGLAGTQGSIGEQGPVGPQGEKGEKGDKGDKGEPGDVGGGGAVTNGSTLVVGLPNSYIEPSAGTGVSTAGAQVTSIATCTDGKVLLGGGAESTTTDSGKYKVNITSSYPSSTTTWTAVATETTDLTADKTMTVTAYALCSL